MPTWFGFDLCNCNKIHTLTNLNLSKHVLCVTTYSCSFCSLSWHRNGSFSSCLLRDVQGGGLVQRCRWILWTGGCGKVEGCTFVISQHRERSAGCSVTTSSPLLSLSTPLQGFKPRFVSLTNNSFDLLLYTDENVDFLLLCGRLTLSHLLYYCESLT